MATVCGIPGYVTTFEAAEDLGVSHAQVTRYISNGQLPAQKVGNQWFIRNRDLKSFRRPPRGNPNFRDGKKS